MALLLMAVVAMSAGIYPDDHWSYSTKITTSNVDEVIKTSVDAGKTLFVRWIASEGWGWWRKQAPSWNSVTKAFASNPDVVFGDVNLQTDQVRGTHSPGAGGWPSVKYFNKETGYAGKHYEKKTQKAICDELGDIKYMTAFVEEAGKTSASKIREL